MATEDNTTDKPGFIPANEMTSTLDDLYQAYADAAASGDNAKRSVIAKLIQSEEQEFAGSEASNMAAAEGRGIEGSGAAQDYIKDFGKVMAQLGIETLGGINRLMPRDDPSGEPSDYYGLIDAPSTLFSHALGFSGDQEELGGLTIPTDQFLSNDRFVQHMQQLEQRARLNAATNISKELGASLRKGDLTGDYTDFNAVLASLDQEAENNEDLALRLQNYKDGTWQVAKYDETGENIIIESLPEVGQFEDERMFGFDMTLDPYFSKSGDLVLPGEGVFGMRNGELRQVASSMSRPLDEMLMYGIPGGEYMAKNVTDKIAFQGPEMLPPEDTGAGYKHGLAAGLLRGVGWPLLKGGYKVGKKGYNLVKGSPKKDIERIEPQLEGILSNIR